MKQNQIDQGIRLKKLIKALNLNQLSFAKSLNVAQPNISRIINGGGNLSLEILNRLAKRHEEVNLHWLLTGIGEMFLDDKQTRNLLVQEDQAVYGKGQLEERVERLEETVKELVAQHRIELNS